MDLFQRENVRVDLFKAILQAFVNRFISYRKRFFSKFDNSRNSQEKTNDPVLIAAMVYCAKSVHDTLGLVCCI